jgi:hypothetical protein
MYYHMPYNSGSCLPAWEGSGAAMCLTAPDPSSLLGKALALPHAPQLQTPPPCSGGIQRCHVPCGSGLCLPAREGSNAATCTAALSGP